MMKRSEKNNMNSDYLSMQKIEKYLSGKMGKEEMHDTELKFENNSFNAAAADGFVENPGAIKDLKNINKAFAKSLIEKNKSSIAKFSVYFSAAASVVLLLSTFIFINYYYKNNTPTIVENIEEKQPHSKEIFNPVSYLPDTFLANNNNIIENDVAFSSSSNSGSAIPINASSVDLFNIEVITNDINFDLNETVPEEHEEVVVLDSSPVNAMNVDIGVSKGMVTDEYESSNSAYEWDGTIETKSVAIDGQAIKHTTPKALNTEYMDEVVVMDYSMNVEERVAVQSITPQSITPQNIIAQEDGEMSITEILNYDIIDYRAVYGGEIKIEKLTVGNKLYKSLENERKNKDMNQAEQEVKYISYFDLLEESLAYFNDEEYDKAINNFSIILKEYPKELNAIFYSGLAYFEIGEYDNAIEKLNFVIYHHEGFFNPDASWYKALALIKLERIDDAKLLLQKIKDSKGAYSRKAKRQLRKLD